MTHISLLDTAIKSFVEAPRRTCGRVVYTKEQLQSLRFSRIAREWPPIFDRRFSRSKFGKNNHLYPQFNRLSYNKSFNRISDPSRFDNDRGDNKKLLYLCDDAVVSAAVDNYSCSTNDRDSKLNFYDKPTLSLPAIRNRQRIVKYPANKPEWYVHGPRVVEEGMEISDLNVHDGGDSPSSCQIKFIDDEKENASKPSRRDYKSVERYDGLAPRFQYRFSSKMIRNEPERNCFRIDRQPDVTTLREIESNVNIKLENASHKCDINDYYGLLGFNGKSTPNSLTESVQVEDSSKHSSDCSTNNNQPHTAQCKLVHCAGQLLSDPAVSEFVGKGCSLCTDLSQESNMNMMRAKEKLEMATKMTCNPLTASYQRQMIASGPFGHNAVRWFKAMTNAAAASACINQRLDESAAQSAAKKSGEKFSETDVQEKAHFNGHENFCQKPNEYDRWQADMTTPVIPLQKPLFDWPFYLGSARYMLDSALGVGLNRSTRHLKPPMLYFHTQMMQFLSRPVVHPLILQQLLYRHLGFRNPALQLPFNCLRTQVMMQLPFEANCLPNFQTPVGAENPQEHLLGPQATAQSFSPLIQEVHSAEP